MSSQIFAPLPTKLNVIPVPDSITNNPVLRALAQHKPIQGEIPHCTPNEIVPEELQNRLMALDDAMTKCYFEIGDIANVLISLAPQVTENRQKIVTEQDVFNAVGVYCHRSGRTVRYYSETAEFYPEHVRREFDVLPFTHFVVARSFAGRWREVLEYARDNPTIGEDRLRDHFSVTIDADYERQQQFYQDHPEIAEVMQGVLNKEGAVLDPSNLRKQRSQSSLLLSALSSLVDRLNSLGANLEGDERQRLLAILDDVRNLIADVQKGLSPHDIM